MATQTKGRGTMALLRVLGLAVGVGILAFFLSQGVLSPAELFAGDLMFRIRGERAEETPVVLVAIDDASFDFNGYQWPWPRDYIAEIVDRVAEGGAKVIAIDVLFYEASVAAEDSELARSIADAGNVILVNNITTQEQGGLVISKYNRPIPELDAASILGLTNFPTDPDGKVRRLQAYQLYSGEIYYSWSMQAARMYFDEDDFNMVTPEEIWIGDHPVQLDGQRLLVNFRGETGETIKTFSAYQVAEEGYMDPTVFKDKIVIIGTTSPSLHDEYITPFGATPMPGAEINAHAVDTILNGLYVIQPKSFVLLLISLAAAFIGVGLTIRTRPLVGLIIVAALIGIYGILGAVLFIQVHTLLPMFGPALAIGLSFVTNTSIQLYEEQKARARVRALFDRYVSSAAIDQMLNQPDSYALSGQRREMTILFSDIRGFTSLSEQLEPDQVVAILNEYLGVMTETVFKYKGTIDKFEGDAILAIWNAPLDVPDHPSMAVKCAIEMAHRLADMQKEWASTGQLVLRNGIGINTGVCFVGNIGSAQRMDYTVIGDTVNLAARLEALTKEVGVQILYTRETHEKLTDDIHSRYIASATVKGREKPVEVYTVDPGQHNLHVDDGVKLDAMPTEITQISKE